MTKLVDAEVSIFRRRLYVASPRVLASKGAAKARSCMLALHGELKETRAFAIPEVMTALMDDALREQDGRGRHDLCRIAGRLRNPYSILASGCFRWNNVLRSFRSCGIRAADQDGQVAGA